MKTLSVSELTEEASSLSRRPCVDDNKAFSLRLVVNPLILRFTENGLVSNTYGSVPGHFEGIQLNGQLNAPSILFSLFYFLQGYSFFWGWGLKYVTFFKYLKTRGVSPPPHPFFLRLPRICSQ